MSRKSYIRNRIEKIREARSLAGKKGNEAKARLRMEQATYEWSLVRVIEIKNGSGEIRSVWRVYSTGNPAWPLSVDFDGKVHRYMAAKRLSALISRKLFDVSITT